MNWFKQSQQSDVLTNEDGTPRVFYHGSRKAELTNFDESFIGTGITSPFQKTEYGGFFFTSDRENAEFYADPTCTIEPLSPDNISIYGEPQEFYYLVDAGYDEEGDLLDGNELNTGPYDTEEEAEKAAKEAIEIFNHKIKEDETGPWIVKAYLRISNPFVVKDREMSPATAIPIAKEQGHDGVLVLDYLDGYTHSDIAVVFSPSQIQVIR